MIETSINNGDCGNNDNVQWEPGFKGSILNKTGKKMIIAKNMPLSLDGNAHLNSSLRPIYSLLTNWIYKGVLRCVLSQEPSFTVLPSRSMLYSFYLSFFILLIFLFFSAIKLPTLILWASIQKLYSCNNSFSLCPEATLHLIQILPVT